MTCIRNPCPSPKPAWPSTSRTRRTDRRTSQRLRASSQSILGGPRTMAFGFLFRLYQTRRSRAAQTDTQQNTTVLPFGGYLGPPNPIIIVVYTRFPDSQCRAHQNPVGHFIWSVIIKFTYAGLRARRVLNKEIKSDLFASSIPCPWARRVGGGGERAWTDPGSSQS